MLERQCVSIRAGDDGCRKKKWSWAIANNRDCYFRDLGHLEVCNRKIKKTGFSELFEEGTRWKELAGVLLFYKGVSHELTISPGQTRRLALFYKEISVLAFGLSGVHARVCV